MRLLACLAFLLMLAGCGGGPDADRLREDVSARLAQALPAGTVEILRFGARGSQRDARAPAGSERRVAYFDVDLRLARDYNLGAWDSPGVAGLVSALGTGPRGLSGIVSGGNRAGDVIRAHGSMLYAREADAWKLLSPQGFGPVAVPAYASGAPRPAMESLLDALRGALDRMPPDASPALRDVVTQELQAAYRVIGARLARESAGYVLAAGPSGGQYLRFAQALARNGGKRIVPLATLGGEENLRLLREGQVDLALSQGDAALDAYEGRGAFAAAGPHATLRAIGSLYPEAVHVLVGRDAPLRTIADLRGRRVAIGEGGSAARATALRMLEAHGVAAADIDARPLGLGDALQALGAGSVDAAITVIGFPADSIREAETAMPLRLLPLEAAALKRLTDANSSYLAFTLPAGTYVAQPRATPTLATPAVLLARADMSDAEIVEISRLVYARGSDLVANGSSQGAQIDAASARLGLAVPMHLAAAAAL